MCSGTGYDCNMIVKFLNLVINDAVTIRLAEFGVSRDHGPSRLIVTTNLWNRILT